MGEMLCGGHWNDRNLGNVWCTNCTCFWFPPQLMAVWPWHPGKFLPISGGQSARRYICSRGCRTGMVQILTVIGWHQAPGMRHAAGHLPSVSASEHWDTLLESFWTPHQQLACFLWPWPVWAHFLMCRARVLTFGVQRWSFASCLFVAILHGMWDLCSSIRDWTHISCSGRQSLNHWATREVLKFSSSAPALLSWAWHSPDYKILQ